MLHDTSHQTDLPDALQEERRAHAAFEASRCVVYRRPGDAFERLERHAAGTGAPLVIYAPPGAGKSALVANWVRHQRNAPTPLAEIIHHVGQSPAGSDRFAVMRHLMLELRQDFEHSPELPTTAESIEREFASWIWMTRKPVVMVVDGLDALGDDAGSIRWLPAKIPGSVRLIVTTNSESQRAALAEQRWDVMTVQPLTLEQRMEIAHELIGEQRTGLGAGQMHPIANDAGSANPLLLRARTGVIGAAALAGDTARAIRRCLDAGTLADVHQLALEQLEESFGREMVEGMLRLVDASLAGLSLDELEDLCQASRDTIEQLTREFTLRGVLLARNGVMDFFHDSHRMAVADRYAPDAGGLHRLIGTYFMHQPVSLRTARERAYQFHAVEDWQTLADALRPLDVLESLCNDAAYYQLLEYWKELQSRGIDLEHIYIDELHAAHARGDPQFGRLSAMLARLLEQISRWEPSRRIRQGQQQWAQTAGDTTAEADARRGVGSVERKLGNYDAALGHLHAALEHYQAHGPTSEAGTTLRYIGEVHELRGAFDEALDCFERSLEVFVSLGDNHGIAWCVWSIGNIHAIRGQYDRALECYRRSLKIYRQLSDLRGVAGALHNIGGIHYHRGDYDKALAELGQAIEMYERLNDRNSMATIVQNMGVLHEQQEHYEQALECYQRSLAMRREQGDRQGMAITMHNIGAIHGGRRDYDAALEYYKESLRLKQELGNPHGTAVTLHNIGRIHAELGDIPSALECYNRSQNLYRDADDQRGVALNTARIAQIDAMRGNHADALAGYEAALAQHRAIGAQAEVAEWLLAIAGLLLTLVEDPGATGRTLAEYLPGASPGNWRQQVLQRAETLSEESGRIINELDLQQLRPECTAQQARIKRHRDDLEGVG